jgi:hypothetical protein
MLTISTADEVLAALLGTEPGQADPFPLYRRLRELGLPCARLRSIGWDPLHAD